jgi:tripartite-type tricarboxylate transporter receptor subunit TctC
MKRILKKGILLLITIMVLGGFAVSLMAADFPAKPVTLIVPWTPGGSTDVCLRVLAELTGKYLGQPMVVENKAGAGGTLGAETLAVSAQPDGYTIAQIPVSVFRLPYMQKMNYDPLKDFSYIINVSGYTFGIVVKKDAPWKTFNEFIAYAKANPGKVTYATPGTGTSLHLTMEMLALKQGIQWTHVPFKGNAETTEAVLAGQVTVAADASGWGPKVESGDLRLLVTWGNNRSARWHNVPTLKELGYGIVSNSPFGIAGPKGMDPKVVKALHDAFRKAMKDPDFQKVMDKLDMEPFYLGTFEYTKYAKEMSDEAKDLVEKLDLKKK